jgi:hypothetical protein
MRTKILNIFSISILLLSALFPNHSSVAAEIPDADELYQGVGIDPARTLYGNDPTEYIDPFSGQLLLNNVDLRLPGNGGLDLVIQRNYLSQDHDWRIIFGRIKYKSGLVTLEMADGSVHYGYAVPNTNNTEFLTKEFWKIHYPVGANETNPPYATLTDGTVITFAYKPVGSFYATSIEKNNNKISIHYTKIAADVAFPIYFDVLDYVEDSIGRKVYFTHDFLGDSVKLVKISYCPDYSDTCSEADRRKIQYKYKDYEYSSHRLEEVKPPQGPSWHYDYSPENSYRLVS